MRVLVTGAAGQVASGVVRAFDGHEVIAATREQLNLADRDSVMASICSTEPDIVIHPGAWTAVDECEADPERAFIVNALGTRHVASAARIVGAHVCYVSTNYVFDGESDSPYHEWCQPNPRTVYGASKLAGEREVAQLCPDATIVRTSAVVSTHGKNFLTTMLRLARERPVIAVVADQWDCPTFAIDLAPVLRVLSVGRFAGTYHVCNSGATTWFEFARAILEAAGDDPSKVHAITAEEWGAPARRPRNGALDNVALRAVGLPPLPDWRTTLSRVIRDVAMEERV